MINKVILVGNVGKDPQVRTIDNGAKVATFTLATSESYKDKSGQVVRNTEWHNIVAWRGLADITERYIKTGSQLYIEGKIRTRSYEDKTTNVKKYITEIVADTIQLLGRKPEGNESTYPSAASAENPPVSVEDVSVGSEDLPF